MKIAILVGNVEYTSLSKLECCHDDLLAMQELLQTSEKYAQIEVIENEESDSLKSKIRKICDSSGDVEELFFYFTGHGCQLEDEFYFCASNFESRRPNETGISNAELHTLLKLANAELVVKVVDACNSGTLLVKADAGFAPSHKHGFKNLIQISSCLDSQYSLTGDPLSLFTEKFRAAALRKSEGPIYYTDIIYALRDEFIRNESQTPFFVSQGTGRELFVENGACFDLLREKMALINDSAQELPNSEENEMRPPTFRQLLELAEERIANAENVSEFTDRFFDSLSESVAKSDFSDYFERYVKVYPNFQEPVTEGFLIRVLSKEKRPDNFVTANVKREKRQRNPWDSLGSLAALNMFGSDQQYVETHELELNCVLRKAQIRIVLTPKYRTLKRIVLIVTCAPSLEYCYLFELASQHVLKDYNVFSEEGEEIVRRWYKLGWSDDLSGVVEKITAKLKETVDLQLEATQRWLEGEKEK